MKTVVEDHQITSVPRDLDLSRVGALAGIASAVVGIAANALHPRLGPADLGNRRELVEMVAGYRLWRIDHLAIILSLLLGLIALIAIARSISDFPAASWGRIAVGVAVASGAVGAASFSIDGFVLPGIAADWAAASDAHQAAILERMAIVEQFDSALFAMTVIGFFGATQLLYGIALSQSRSYPKWVSMTALLGGITGLGSGTWMWLSGTLNVGNFLILFTLSSVLVTIWILGASLLLLQRTRGPGSIETLDSLGTST